VSPPDELEQLVTELEDVAAQLRSGELAPDAAAELVQRSAELAGRLGSELDARGRSAGRIEGQERLL
jgi:hypothetical protein